MGTLVIFWMASYPAGYRKAETVTGIYKKESESFLIRDYRPEKDGMNNGEKKILKNKRKSETI